MFTVQEVLSLFNNSRRHFRFRIARNNRTLFDGYQNGVMWHGIPEQLLDLQVLKIDTFKTTKARHDAIILRVR